MIKIADKSSCCGCEACRNVCPRQCITMQEDREGFVYPEVDATACVDCGLCETVCPVLHPGQRRLPVEAYAARNRDESVRLASSSGGVFTRLAEWILDRGGVVFGARFNENGRLSTIMPRRVRLLLDSGDLNMYKAGSAIPIDRQNAF